MGAQRDRDQKVAIRGSSLATDSSPRSLGTGCRRMRLRARWWESTTRPDGPVQGWLPPRSRGRLHGLHEDRQRPPQYLAAGLAPLGMTQSHHNHLV